MLIIPNELDRVVCSFLLESATLHSCHFVAFSANYVMLIVIVYVYPFDSFNSLPAKADSSNLIDTVYILPEVFLESIH